jgi:hypothetical protein
VSLGLPSNVISNLSYIMPGFFIYSRLVTPPSISLISRSKLSPFLSLDLPILLFLFDIVSKILIVVQLSVR